MLSVQAACECRAAELRDPRSWSDLLRDADVVVHLSSRTDLHAAEADPAEDEDINVRPLRALVEAARAADATPRIIFASAVTIVGPNPKIPVDDSAPDDPCSVYDRTSSGARSFCARRQPAVSFGRALFGCRMSMGLAAPRLTPTEASSTS